MKAVVLFLILSLASFAQADHYSNKEILDCRVTRMVNYHWEEALSAFEYPDVEVSVSPTGEYTMGIGGNSPYEKSEGDTVTIKRDGRADRVVTVKTHRGEIVTLQVEYRTSLARATLRVQEPDAKKPFTVAYLLCNTGIF